MLVLQIIIIMLGYPYAMYDCLNMRRFAKTNYLGACSFLIMLHHIPSTLL